MENQQELTQEQQQEWVRSHYQQALKYLAEKGILGVNVKADKSRYLIPAVAIWYIEDGSKQGYWVINGDVPADHVQIETAPDARESLRHFSMKWQLQAENLVKSEDEKQQEFGRMLIGRAEGLYQLFEKEELWG